jgi:uncharacterized protein YjbJ (UPF0337 family)
MSEQSKQDRLEGEFEEAKGRGKEGLGRLAGDRSTELEGKRDQATGKARQGMADLEEKADDMVKDFTNREDR